MPIGMMSRKLSRDGPVNLKGLMYINMIARKGRQVYFVWRKLDYGTTNIIKKAFAKTHSKVSMNRRGRFADYVDNQL